MVRILFDGKSDVGLKRPNNEDIFVFDPELAYCLAADGMGGAAAGELASSFFAEAVAVVFAGSSNRSEMETVGLVQDAFHYANQRILEHVQEEAAHEGMGCTAELLAFSNEGFALGHIGDSRTYRLRGGQLKQLTTDHSYVQDQINQGLMSPAEAKNHRLRGVILRAVGVEEDLTLDISKGKTFSGDMFLLCSDGLTDMVDDDQMQQVLSTRASLSQKVNDLIETAKDAGGYDNITAVLAEIL